MKLLKISSLEHSVFIGLYIDTSWSRVHSFNEWQIQSKESLCHYLRLSPSSSVGVAVVFPIYSVKKNHTAPNATKQEDLEFFWSKCWEWEVSNKMLYLFPVFKSGNIMWHNIFVYYMYSRMLSIMHHKMVEARVY